MISLRSRRSLLKFASVLFPASAMDPLRLLGLEGRGAGNVGFANSSLAISSLAISNLAISNDDARNLPTPDIFPTQPPELVREMVLVSHFNLARVRELVEARPSLAKASWDWGFGDWESALGAASHVGNKPIAEYLISKGARPSLFSATMLGQLEVVKAFVTAQPGVQRIRGPHSITLLAHAKAGGEAARPVFEYLQSLKDADADPPIPLPEADIARFPGTYVFGPVVNQQIEITADKGLLTWTRKGTTGRGLVHLGDRTFHPMGAASVRIRFAEDPGGMVMTINDPDLVLTARRKSEAK
jgi:hypothetical protein